MISTALPMQKTAVSRPQIRTVASPVDRPWAVKMLISVMKFAEGIGLPKYEVSPDAMLRQVSRKMGRDWQDRSFEEPLRILAQSLNEEADLHPLGSALMVSSSKMFLKNRLLLEHAWRQNPAALSAPVRQPLYVIGLPRTGTTLLYNLLCQDPTGRPLMGWETFMPAPEVGRNGRALRDRRRKQSGQVVRGLNWMAPRLKAVHELVADGPEECTWLLHNSFLSPSFLLQAHIPTYAKYVISRSREDWRRVYTEYANALRLLQQGSSAHHWVLKSPAHQVGLAGLLDVIPNACVVQTHREPKQVIGSCCSLFSVVRKIYSDRVCDQTLGPEVLDNLHTAVTKAMEARDEQPHRFFDVRFDQLLSDPIGTVKRIYDHFRYPFDPRMETGMQRWLAENPQGKHGKHRYDLAQFGLTEDDVETEFSDYRMRYEAVTARF